MENLIAKIDPTQLPVCPVCLNDMAKLESGLIITSCGHSFCGACWDIIWKNNNNNNNDEANDALKCPECNTTKIRITKNYAAMQLGEYIVKCHE